MEENLIMGIDLNEELITNRPSTFFFRMSGDAMIDEGIFSGDVLIVDRSITKTEGRVVVVVLNGEMLVRRIEKKPFMNTVKLIPSNQKLSATLVEPFDEFSVWGVVTATIRQFK